MISAMIVEHNGNPNYNHKIITRVSYAVIYTESTIDMKRKSVPAIKLNE